MLAVFVNMGTVLVGSTIGLLFRNKIKETYIQTIISALGLITIVIGVSSAIKTANLLCLIVSLVAGSIVGEGLRIEERLDGMGDKIDP